MSEIKFCKDCRYSKYVNAFVVHDTHDLPPAPSGAVCYLVKRKKYPLTERAEGVKLKVSKFQRHPVSFSFRL